MIGEGEAGAIYAVVIAYDRCDGTADVAADRARRLARPAYHRPLELHSRDWASRVDCHLFASAATAAAALATLGPRERCCATPALLLGEGARPGADDVTLLRGGRRERFALAAPTVTLW